MLRCLRHWLWAVTAEEVLATIVIFTFDKHHHGAFMLNWLPKVREFADLLVLGKLFHHWPWALERSWSLRWGNLSNDLFEGLDHRLPKFTRYELGRHEATMVLLILLVVFATHWKGVHIDLPRLALLSINDADRHSLLVSDQRQENFVDEEHVPLGSQAIQVFDDSRGQLFLKLLVASWNSEN